MRFTTPTTSVIAAVLLAATPALAASAEEWKNRAIYQIITDRFAPPSDTAPARTNPLSEVCDESLQTWCGGTWLSIIDKLDYIQGMGFDAIWISPTGQNIDIHTPYNYAYHGYWVNDPMTVNPRFGSEDDLKALSKALHDRDMFFMVDVAVNNVPSLNTHDSQDENALSADNSRWTKPEYFHEHCWIDYNNVTSVEQCWLGDDNLPLMDVNTEHPDVISQLEAWIPEYVKTYGIDGLRIDAAKHVRSDFWPGFCGAAGVFCIGEVYGDDMQFAADWQRHNYMDSILGFPLYYGINAGFGTPMGNMSHFIDISRQVLSNFPHPEYLGNFIENHDLPRFRNSTVDPQLAYNAMIVQFVFEGIPVVYQGQEQEISFGLADPYNRNAIWAYNYTNTTTYQRMGRLNEVRSALISNGTQYNGQTFMDARSDIIASSDYDVAIRKGPMLAVLTNRGSPVVNATFGIRNSGWPSSSVVVDILSCRQMPVGSEDSITISYAQPGYGGMPYVFLSLSDAQSIGVCGLSKAVRAVDTPTTSTRKDDSKNAALGLNAPSAGLLSLAMLIVAALATLT